MGNRTRSSRLESSSLHHDTRLSVCAELEALYVPSFTFLFTKLRSLPVSKSEAINACRESTLISTIIVAGRNRVFLKVRLSDLQSQKSFGMLMGDCLMGGTGPDS